MQTFVTETEKLLNRGPLRVSPLFIPMMIGNIASGNIAIKFNAQGPSLPVVTACATSTNAIGEAFRAIRFGYADAILAGGAEATIIPLAVADQVWMLENSFYSVISPEGGASIIWKDSKRAKEASECLKLTAEDLLSFGVIERIIGEEGGLDEICAQMKAGFPEVIGECREAGVQHMLEARYAKYRKIGGETL